MRVALIGLGGAGAVHLAALDRVPWAQIVGVVDPHPDAHERAQARGVVVYPDVPTLLDRARPDVVTISSPPSEHASLAVACLEAGSHVLCEKPLAISATAALEMTRAASTAKRHLVLATKFRHVEDILTAQRCLQDGTIGDPISFAISFCSRVDMAGRWNSRREISGGGVVIDNGCHAFDIVSFLFGSVTHVHASMLRRLQAIDVEDSALIKIQAANGVFGTIELSWSYFTGRDSYLTVQGSEGAIEIGWRKSRIKLDGGEWRDLEGERYNKFSSHQRMYEAFGELLTKGGAPWISTVDALRTVAATEAAYRSLETGGWERVDARDATDGEARKRA